MESLSQSITAEKLSLLGDYIVTELPLLNNTANRRALLEFSISSIASISSIDFFTLSLFEAQAIQRDVGFMAASLVRHGYQIGEIPQIVNVLIQISAITHEIPRDTLYSYTIRNPKGEKMRTFTGSKEERIFIESTGSAVAATEQAIIILSQAQRFDITSKDFTEAVRSGHQALQEMVKSILITKNSITPDFFTNKLRPYFPPMEIDGKVYYAPGGAQMPILLIDQLVWGADMKDLDYKAYLKDNMQYLPPSLREISKHISYTSSFVSRIESESVKWINREAVRALINLLDATISFRYPHLRIAKENMHLRNEKSLGSGGYDLDILKKLIGHTQSARERLKAILS